MSKYEGLREHLTRQSGSVTLSLEEVSELVKGGLPPSAYMYEVWWADDDSTHSQSRSWGDAGYRAHPDLTRRTVRFAPR